MISNLPSWDESFLKVFSRKLFKNRVALSKRNDASKKLFNQLKEASIKECYGEKKPISNSFKTHSIGKCPFESPGFRIGEKNNG